MVITGRTLIVVPCWWDGSIESLAVTIRRARPDLLHFYKGLHYAPISETPPVHFFEVKNVPNVGELMLASFVPTSSFNTDLWWMGEKFDGMRACWNPWLEILYSRNGLALDMLLLHKSVLPYHVFLDGELWIGRGRFKELAPIFSTKFQKNTFSWEHLRLICFDSPQHNTEQSKFFEGRYACLLRAISCDHLLVLISPRLLCLDRLHMDKYTQEIIQSGGEGVVLRKPNSLYENGRSHSVLKYKVMRDGEALVVGIQGIYYKCKLPNKQLFTARDGANMEIQVGDIVSYKCLSLSWQGLPRQSIVFRKREDLTWEHVVRNDSIEKLRHKLLIKC